jgi:soluble P-type ATPase
MFELDIPGFGMVRLEHLVSDFTGTLSVDGKLLPGVKDRLNKVSQIMKVHILTADTFGMAKEELKNVNCVVHILEGVGHDVRKEIYINKIGPERVIALGNGNNDRKMLKAARIGVAVCLNEGCATDAVKSGDILVTSATDAFDLLLNPNRLKATLRF